MLMENINRTDGFCLIRCTHLSNYSYIDLIPVPNDLPLPALHLWPIFWRWQTQAGNLIGLICLPLLPFDDRQQAIGIGSGRVKLDGLVEESQRLLKVALLKP